MFRTDIAIDLGTSRIRAYKIGSGIVIDEPTVVARNIESNKIIAIGESANQMTYKTSELLEVIHPIENGIISNFELTTKLINFILKKINNTNILMPRVVTNIACDATQIEKRSVIKAINSCGIRKVYFIENPIAAAIGAGIDITRPHGTFIVNMGAGLTDIAVISLSGVVVKCSLRVAGDKFDNDIIKYLYKKHKLIIGKSTAEQAKKAIGCVYPEEQQYSFCVKGRNSITNLPDEKEILSGEIFEATYKTSAQIINGILEVLEQLPPELVNDVIDDGIILTGGLANITGFDKLIKRNTNLPVTVANNPDKCVILGIGNALGYLNALENKPYGVMNPLTSGY